MYPLCGKQLATNRNLPFFTSCLIGLNFSFKLISILAFVQRGTSTTILNSLVPLLSLKKIFNGMTLWFVPDFVLKVPHQRNVMHWRDDLSTFVLEKQPEIVIVETTALDNVGCHSFSDS